MASGYDCEFVYGPPKELHSECSICLMVLRQPYLVSCCGHHFCKGCLEGVSKVNKICPLCKEEQFTSIPNKGLERVLNEKQIYCTNKKSGCEWSGELRQLESHLNESVPTLASLDKKTGSLKQEKKVVEVCQFVEVRCQNCPTTLKRSEMKKHLTECPNRPMQCKHCKNHTATAQELVEKHQPVCPKFPVSCPNKCGASIQRKNVAKHVDNTCPLSKLPCEYSHVGCTVVMTRKKMESHLKSAPGMAVHLSLMDKAYLDLKKNQSEPGKEETDTEKFKLTRQIKTLESKLVMFQESYTHQLKSFEQRKAELESVINHQQMEISRLEVENKRLRAKLGKMSSSDYNSEDVDFGGDGAKPSHKSMKPPYSIKKATPNHKSSSSRKKSADSGEDDGFGWGTALSLAAGVGLGLAGAAALASQSSSDKEKKSKDSSWF